MRAFQVQGILTMQSVPRYLVFILVLPHGPPGLQLQPHTAHKPRKKWNLCLKDQIKHTIGPYLISYCSIWHVKHKPFQGS